MADACDEMGYWLACIGDPFAHAEWEKHDAALHAEIELLQADVTRLSEALAEHVARRVDGAAPPEPEQVVAIEEALMDAHRVVVTPEVRPSVCPSGCENGVDPDWQEGDTLAMKACPDPWHAALSGQQDTERTE